MRLRMTEEDLAALERGGSVRVRRDPKPAPAPAPAPTPVQLPAPNVTVQAAKVDMQPVAQALEGGLTEVAKMLAEALRAKPQEKPAAGPAPIKSVDVEVMSRDMGGAITKMRLTINR